jgi:hypothetical protein
MDSEVIEQRNCNASVETNHFETSIPEFMDQPRHHRPRLDTDLGIITCMASNRSLDLIGARCANTAHFGDSPQLAFRTDELG